MNAEKLADLIADKTGFPAKRDGNGWKTRCPNHQDKTPSLHITEGTDGRKLVKCFAGCPTEAVMAAVGLKMANLMPAKETSTKPRIVATYGYTDANGLLLYNVIRKQPKAFIQCRPDGQGHWIYGLNAGEYAQGSDGNWYIVKDRKPANAPRKHFPEQCRVLYRLPPVIKQVQSGGAVWIVEGEKDADTMVKSGFIATTSPAGAGNFHMVDNTPLNGANCIIIADADTPGRRHAQQVATLLHPKASSVKVIELPQKDASDFFAAGGTADQLEELAMAAPIWAPDAAPRNDLLSEYLPSEPEEQNEKPSFPSITCASVLVESPGDEPKQLVRGIIHQSTKVVLGGASKANKTWVLTDLGVSVSHGLPWLGFETEQTRVLFINLEIARNFFARRLAVVAKAKGIGIEPGRLDVWNLRGHCAPYDKLLPEIERRVENGKYGLIIADPVYKLTTGLDENSAGDIGNVMAAFERLAVSTGATVAFAAHYAKGNASSKDGIDRISGSGVFARDPDTILPMTRHESDGSFTIEPILRNLPPVQPFVITWQYPLMHRDNALDPAALKKPLNGKQSSVTLEKVQSLCLAGMSKAELVEALINETGCGKSYAYRRIDETESAKRIIRHKNKTYGPTLKN